MGGLQSTPYETLVENNKMQEKFLREAKKYATDSDDMMENLPKGVTAPYLGTLRTLYLIQKYQNNLCFLPGIRLIIKEAQFNQVRFNPSFNPQKSLEEEMYVERTFDNKQLAEEIRRVRKHCLDDQILIINLTLAFENDGHAVVVLINDETFEYYDPESSRETNSLTTFVNDMLQEVADELQLRYLPSVEVCPVGTQTIETARNFPNKKGDPKGFCVDWSNLYIQMRLQFPEVSGKQITQTFFNFIEDYRINIRDFIRGMSRRYVNYDVVMNGQKLDFEKFENMDYLLNFIEFTLPYAMMSGHAKIIPKKKVI